MLIPVAAFLAMQVAAAEAPIGVAVALPEGPICVAMPEPALAPGTTLTLIQPDAPQSALVATILRPVPACERLGGAMIPGPYYHAHRPASMASEPGTLWVAFAGKVETGRLGSGAVVVRFSAAHPNPQVRSCTSHEGLHLTAWSDTPLTSQLLWHQYYYLGYDVEPSCDEREVRDVEAEPAAPAGSRGAGPTLVKSFTISLGVSPWRAGLRDWAASATVLGISPRGGGRCRMSNRSTPLSIIDEGWGACTGMGGRKASVQRSRVMLHRTFALAVHLEVRN